ncbi:MAG: hypothetical protein ACLUQN_02590, partial [Megasphaera sp.]
MIHFTVGPLHRPTTVAGAMKHFGVSSTLRRRIKHSGSCTINGQPASTRDFVREGIDNAKIEEYANDSFYSRS